MRGEGTGTCRNGDQEKAEPGQMVGIGSVDPGRGQSHGEKEKGQRGGCGAWQLLVAARLLCGGCGLTPVTQPQSRPSRVLCLPGCSFSPSSHGPCLLLSQDAAHFRVLWENIPDSHACGRYRPVLPEQPGLNSTQDRLYNRTAACLLVPALDPSRDHGDPQPSHSPQRLRSERRAEMFMERMDELVEG